MKIGTYVVKVVQKGCEETALDLEEGTVFYTVRLDKESYFDVDTMVEAEILSRLIRIEIMLKNIK